MAELRARIRAFLGLSSPPPAPPAIAVLDRYEADGYTRSLIRYAAPDADAIDAFLFQPAGHAGGAAVLALHQHNSQWAIGKSEIAGLGGDPCQTFGPELARRGLSVLAPDAVGFESRVGPAGAGTSLAPPLGKTYSSADGWRQYYNQMAHRLVQGDLLIRKALSDCALGLSVLQTLPQTPTTTPVGVIGHSYGGILALFLAGLDTRVEFACSSGAACSFRHKLANGTALDMSLVIPGFATRFDLEDIIRCVAPRRLLVVSSDADPASADADRLCREARPAFEACGCAGHLQHLRTAGAHALDPERFEAIVGWIVTQS